MYIYLSYIRLSVNPFVCKSIGLYIPLSVYQLIFMSISLPMFLSLFYLFTHHLYFFYLSVYLLCLSVCLSVCLYVCLFTVYLSGYQKSSFFMYVQLFIYFYTIFISTIFRMRFRPVLLDDIFPSFHFSVFQSFRLSVFPSFHSVNLGVFLSVCIYTKSFTLSICMSQLPYHHFKYNL